MMVTATRRLTFCAGHRLLGHEGACRYPHGHNYVVEVSCEAETDAVGRVLDFHEIKLLVGGWVQHNLDHAFIVNENDTKMLEALVASSTDREGKDVRVYCMKANPTAENLARLLFRVTETLLRTRPVNVVRVVVRETENCWAEATGCDGTE